MIFSTGLKKIYEAIKKQPKARQNALYNQLQEKISSNPILAYKFNLLEAIESNKRKFDKDSATKFVSNLKTQHNKFLKENNSVAIFYKEEKKLFEFFNINQQDVVSTKLDLIVNKKDNELNENIIVEYITDNRLMTNKDRLKLTQEDVRKQLIYAKRNGNDSILTKQFEAIKKKSSKLSSKRKLMIEESLKTIKVEAFKNFNSACDKTYKLRVITEKFLLEGPEDIKGINKSMEKQERGIEGKVFKMPNLSYIKNINIEVPDLFDKSATGLAEEDDSVIINFSIMLFPKFAKLSQSLAIDTGMPKLRNNLKGLRRLFMNKFIYQANISLLNPMDAVWNIEEISLPENLNPEGGTHGGQVEANGFYWVTPRFEVTIQTKENAKPEEYANVSYEILKNFNDFLPEIDFLSEILTPDAQKELIAKTPKGRSTEYGDRTGANKYYNDTHGPKSDKFTDTIMGGEADDSEVEDWNGSDYKFGKNKGEEEDFAFDFDEDEAIKKAEALAKAKTKREQTNSATPAPKPVNRPQSSPNISYGK